MCSINHDKKAIFIHIPKTAGIYIRQTLSNHYDFETYLFKRPDHEIYCKTNYKLNKSKSLYFANNINGVINYYKTSDYLNNLMNMDNDKWNEYYKFCFVRNPYDRAVSAWNYLNDTEKLNIDFDVYLDMKNIVSENEYFHIFMDQTTNVIDGDNKNVLFIDYIGKFENLEEDFKKILINIGFKEDEITHDKKPINKRAHKKYLEYYNDKNIKKINEIYKDDFINFDYKMFDDYKKMINYENN